MLMTHKEWQVINLNNIFDFRPLPICFLESFFSVSVSRFIDRVARFVSDKVSGHRPKISSVVISVSVSLQLGSTSTVESLRGGTRG